MRKQYNKLIRDGIPEIMDQAGVAYKLERLDGERYNQALLDKLIEEAKEVAQAEGDDIVTELADLFEVVDALLGTLDIERSAVLAQQAVRREKSGGFEKRLRLLWTQSANHNR